MIRFSDIERGLALLRARCQLKLASERRFSRSGLHLDHPGVTAEHWHAA